MSKLPLNPTGDTGDQENAHTPDKVRTDQSWKKEKDMPEQEETAHPDDYERPPADRASGNRTR
ncbi:hypothetical protein E5C33_13450 [Stenotrophomonas maltophilia]|uniref:hypothetical protein n=1 Tax=Stenotrophomonas maltophilia TaxID=40324 RepID=UPI00107657D4|nr:hypothetical protein [Stenotrophomonas maltophilia]TFZ44648.1 hypothetical protein E5C33_13450 [Stenotrophomonas maltophilia]